MRTALTVSALALLAPLALAAAAVPAAAAEPAAGTSTASVDVFHGVPGLTVDVYAGSKEILKGFTPGSFSPQLQLPAGSYDLRVFKAGAAPSGTPAVEKTVAVAAGHAYTVAAHLSAAGTPELTAYVDDLSAVTAGSGRVTVRHTAAAPAVDVRIGGAVAVPGLTDPGEASLTAPAGTVQAAVDLAGTTTTAIGPASLPVAAGKLTTVYAWGSATAKTLALAVHTYPLTGLSGVPAGQGPASATVPVSLWVAGGAGVALLSGAALSAANRRRSSVLSR